MIKQRRITVYVIKGTVIELGSLLNKMLTIIKV